ncbi:MAG: hypothetical protein WDM90_24370 [Ferruginibacter sp.]
MSRAKKIWVAFGLVIIILIFTNPTNSDLENFLSANGFENNSGGRVSYWGGSL